MILLKGKNTAEKIKSGIARELESLHGTVPAVSLVRVGEKPEDLAYEKSAVKYLEGLGFHVVTRSFPAEITDGEFQNEFLKINRDPSVNGILLFLPLPRTLDSKKITGMTDPDKDLDGIHPVNIAKVFSGDDTGFAPCTAEAVIRILKSENIPVAGKNVTVVGRSMVVGRPLSMLFLRENATVTVCHTKTEDLKAECRRADILVAAAGKAKMLNGDFVKKGAVVIDVGINMGDDGKLCGDVDTDSLEGIASMVTPVPGGVGTVTNAVLAEHLMRAFRKQEKP